MYIHIIIIILHIYILYIHMCVCMDIHISIFRINLWVSRNPGGIAAIRDGRARGEVVGHSEVSQHVWDRCAAVFPEI